MFNCTEILITACCQALLTFECCVEFSSHVDSLQMPEMEKKNKTYTHIPCAIEMYFHDNKGFQFIFGLTVALKSNTNTTLMFSKVQWSLRSIPRHFPGGLRFQRYWSPPGGAARAPGR